MNPWRGSGWNGAVVGLGLALAGGLVLALPTVAWAAPPDQLDAVGQAASSAFAQADGALPPASGAGTALRILVVLTILSLLPAIVLTMTAFTRIMIVFSFLRQSLGIQGMPPNQVLTGMALFLTAFIMAPVGEEIHRDALTPLIEERVTPVQALERASVPLKAFMLAQTDDEDLRLFYDISKRPRPRSRQEVDFVVLVPAFTLSEVRTAFEMGFLVLIPFMVVDLVVSSILMAMGMVMLPPALITLPIKVMIFVLVDGWGLVIGSLARSFQ